MTASAPEPTPSELEQLKQQLQMVLEHYKAALLQAGGFQFSVIGLRALLLIHGGALIALLAYLGNIAGKVDAKRQRHIAHWCTFGLADAKLRSGGASANPSTCRDGLLRSP